MCITTDALFGIAEFGNSAFGTFPINGVSEIKLDPFYKDITTKTFYKDITIAEGEMMNNSIKKGSTSTPLCATLKDSEGVIDLGGADSVELIMTRKSGTVKIDGKAMTIVDAANGEVQYAWEAEDVDEAGTYYIEIRINYGSNYEIVPNYGAISFVIDDV